MFKLTIILDKEGDKIRFLNKFNIFKFKQDNYKGKLNKQKDNKRAIFIAKNNKANINEIKYNEKNKRINENNFEKGILTEKDIISPSYINTINPKYLEIDNRYYVGIIIVDYYREYSDLIFKNLLNTNINMFLSIFYEKQDTFKTIKDLTYYIGNVGINLKDNNANREDIEIAAFSYNDAKYIRKEMQVNNEELYYIYTYVMVYSDKESEVEYLFNKIEGILQSSGLITRRANFRQEPIFFSCLPSMLNCKEIKRAAQRNILSNSLVSTYPFISSNIFDENGVFIGTNSYNNSIILIDRFDSLKYKNANMCVFGTSGAGKSFYIKSLILRYRLLGLSQYVIDPEREYSKICNELDGTLIKLGPTSETYVNVLDIREDSIEEEKGYLLNKLNKLKGFFSLIFENLDEEKYGIIEEKLIETYKRKGITFDDNSLYKNNKFKSSLDMPILSDFYDVISEDKKSSFLKNKLYSFINGSLKFLNKHTNVELNNKLMIADIYELGENNLKYGLFIFTELFWDYVKKDRSEKKSIYLDEIWKLIGVTSNSFVAEFIYKIFKTIRKYGGSAVAITQDVADLFSLEEGAYGRSILNNSSIKNFFSLEEENIKILSQYTNLSEKEMIEIKGLKRGESLMFVGDNHILAKVEVSSFEEEIIS